MYTATRIYKAAAAVLAMGAAAFGQTPAPADSPKPGDRAAAYYHYTLAHMYAELASAYGNRNDYLNKAIDNYKDAIKADPNTPALTEELSELYIASGRLREAQTDAEDALKKNPSDVSARRLLAHVFTRQIGDSQQNKIDESMLHKAIEQYQKIAELDPKDTDSLVMLGRLQKVAQNSVEAEKAYKQALAQEPDNEDALTGLALVYADLGNNAQAAEILKKLAEKNPSARSLRALASAYEQMKEFAMAAQTLSNALELSPPDAAELKHEMAQDYFFARNYDAALKAYQSLVDDEPSDAESYLQMSQVYVAMKNYTKAREMSNKALSIDPARIDIRFNEVSILEAEGKLPEAIQTLKDMLSSTAKGSYNQADKRVRIGLLEKLAALESSADRTDAAVDDLRQMATLDPDLAPRIETSIILTLINGKEHSKAEQEADAAVKKYPDDRSIHTEHAMVIADMGKIDPAAAEIKKLLDGKNDVETYLNLARVYDKGRKFEEETKAIDQAEKLASSKDEKINVWFTRGAMFEKTKKEAPAEAEFRKVLELDPDNIATLNYLGYMLADRNTKLNDALQYITKAVDQDPNNGAYLDSLGWVYFKLGRLPEAEENLRRAVASTPRDATVHDHLGDVLMRESKLREAVAQWEISFKEWNLSPPSELEPAEMAKVKSKLDSAKVRLAKEGSPKQN
jgi:tetratricopeptide (TPR) repeat protein